MDGENFYANYKSMMYILLRIFFSFCGFNGRLVAKNPREIKPSNIQLNTTNTCVMFWFGLVISLAFQYKNFDFNNMVLNQDELVVLQRLLLQIHPLNYGVNITIGLPSKGRNVT